MNKKQNKLSMIAAAFVFGLMTAFTWPMKRLASLRGPKLVYCENTGEGMHDTGNITRKTDAAVATRYLLAKIGTDVDHVNIAGAADTPIGVFTDEAAAAEELVNVALLGSSKGTTKMVASAAIALGALLEPAANGQVVTKGVGAGTHHVVGRALQAAANAGDEIEVQQFYYVQVI